MEPDTESKQNSEIKIDRKSKILFAVLGILIAGSVAVTFWRYMIVKDYIVEAWIDCDPETETCFIWECDPMSLEEGEACIGVPDEDIWYYKILSRNAKNIPLCDPEDEDCEALVCPPGELECEEILCTPETVAEGEVCNDPEQYLLENPPEEEECEMDDEECLLEEEIECEEGDEECLVEEEEIECAPDDEECLTSQEEECAPDDEECLSQQETENVTDETEEGTEPENAEDETESTPMLPGIESAEPM